MQSSIVPQNVADMKAVISKNYFKKIDLAKAKKTGRSELKN